MQRDREMATRTQADTEYLARELAGVRLALADVVTMEDMRDHLERISDVLDRLESGARPDESPRSQDNDA
jgi:uncharacterized membrane protein